MYVILLLLLLVDYTDLNKVALTLYMAGIEEVSSVSMIKKSLNFNSSSRMLEVRLYSYTVCPVNNNVNLAACQVSRTCHHLSLLITDHVWSVVMF